MRKSPSATSDRHHRQLTRVWLLGWLLAAVCFVLAAKQFMAGHELRERILESGRSLDSVPATMLGENPAIGVVWTCGGLVCLLYAFRKSSISFRVR